MLANRILLFSAALGSLLAGCSHTDRADAARKPAATSVPTVAARRDAAPKRAAKRAPPSSAARRTAAKRAAKPGAKPAATGGLVLKVPEAHLPPAGQCRIWREDTSPFQQPQARSCDHILATAPAGSMILYRPSNDRKIVRVRYVDAHRAGVVVRVRVFEAATGKYLRDEKI
jgi:outer membrane murein-binding lipoprotein Lpp